ncbi:uracil-DNA glycosylase family protein [Roseobacter sp.]|uniref:uracil-DNA glycosylase family protein n=1 Tax=Roseobacter sp. TaxID=1907202 RepID=UPI003297FDF7
MTDWPTLTRAMHACTLCQDLPLGPKPVFQLTDTVQILIAGQAPGRIAHIKGRPFDDPSGDRLRGWLGVGRHQFYQDPRVGIFPMGLCFPGSAKSGDAPPRKICATTWRRPVLDRLGDVQLTLILGAYAIAWHVPSLRGATVTDAVRHSADGRDGTFILPHPSPRNNRWFKRNPWFEATVVPRLQDRVRAILQP